jgi:hypothetical protein
LIAIDETCWGAGRWGDRSLSSNIAQPIFLQQYLHVWRGVKEVTRDGDVDLVDGNVALGGNVN